MVHFRPAVLLATAALVALGACSKNDETRIGTNVTAAASDAAGDSSIAKAIDPNSKFAAAIHRAGLDSTFDGPGPYTVLIPDDAAFAKLPASTLDGLMKPEGKARLTRLLTYHVLPGTILSSDIAKAIDVGQGKALLPTMGGGSITATRSGDAIVLQDGINARAKVVGADEPRSNGVVYRIDTVLMPAK